MNIDEQLEQLARMEYPRQVDVVDRVMAQVTTPSVIPMPPHRSLRLPLSAAAAVAILLAVGLPLLHTHSFDNEGLGNSIAQLNDYNSWNTIEEVAMNPYEYLYEE